MFEELILAIIFIAALIIALLFRSKLGYLAQKKPSPSSAGQGFHPTALQLGKVQRIIDGDTVIVSID
jgi:hypothetical protein